MKNKFFNDGEKPFLKDSSDTVPLTAQMFFGANGHAAYFSKEAFIAYGQTLRESEYEDLNIALELMKEAHTMGGSFAKRQDRGNRMYIHPQFFKSKARIGTKIILEGGMEGFVSDYQNGYIRPMFNLDELIEEAQKL